MKVQTFVSKVTIDALQQGDQHINKWLETHNIKPVFVNQFFGYEHAHEGRNDEPVAITAIWY